MMWARATDLGVTIPSEAPLDRDAALMARLEAMRVEAGHMMGLGDCSDRVIPKIGLVAAPIQGGTIAARYFTPNSQHPTFAFTGGICLASLCRLDGTVAADLAESDGTDDVVIEHPSGKLAITIETKPGPNHTEIVRAGAVRTARLIMRGEVCVRPA